MFKSVMNFLFPSRFVFEDGSRVEYLIREDLLVYSTASRLKEIVEIPLIYDKKSDKSHVDPKVTWKWQSTGTALGPNELRHVAQKIDIFLRRRPRDFEPLSQVE
jgi:hypothetical protein